MLKSSVAILAGVGLLSTTIIAQSSQPSGNQPSPKQPPAMQVQPAPQDGPTTEQSKAKFSERKPLFKIIVVPKKEYKTLPTGILDKATLA
jgi:hypothetical protein